VPPVETPKPRLDFKTVSIPDLIVAVHAAFRDDLATQANHDLGQALLEQGPYTAALSAEYNVVYSYLDTSPYWRRTPLPVGQEMTEERLANPW
jgi:hypothetical protein